MEKLCCLEIMSFSQIIRQLAILLHVVLVGEEGKPSNSLLICEHFISNTPVFRITKINWAAQLRLGQVVHSFEDFPGDPCHLNFEVWDDPANHGEHSSNLPADGLAGPISAVGGGHDMTRNCAIPEAEGDRLVHGVDVVLEPDDDLEQEVDAV